MNTNAQIFANVPVECPPGESGAGMNKAMLILAVIGIETTYEHLAMRTGIPLVLLAVPVFHLQRRGFITKSRACRAKPAVFSITESGREQLRNPRRRVHLSRPKSITQAAVSAPHPLHVIWQTATEQS